MRYAYVWDSNIEYYVPQIVVDGPFKGARVDHLPLAETLQKAYVILQALPFVPTVEIRPTRVYFELEFSDQVDNRSLTTQRQSVKELLSDEFGESITFDVREKLTND